MKPNILVVTTDQQHHQMMSCAGNEWLSTPNMDRLAADGVRFSHAYCSNPVCVPSRFSWWTGRMPSAIGMRENGSVRGALPRKVHDGGLGHLGRSAGYRTRFAGKIHLPGDLTPESLGFTYVSSDERDRLAVDAACEIRELGSDATPWLFAVNFINPHDICYQAIRAFADPGTGQRLTDIARVELDEIDVALGLFDAFQREEFFASICPPLPDNHEPQRDEPEEVSRLLGQRRFRGRARAEWSDNDWRLHRWIYHRLTERVDAQLGVVLDALDASGQADNTLVVFTSDHGDHDGSHKLEHKTIFYDEAARVPLIVRHPTRANSEMIGSKGDFRVRRVTNAGLVQTGLDLMATVCDYMQVDSPDHNRGISFRQTADGSRTDAPRDGVYAENEVSLMFTTEQYKFVRYDEGENARQLYDLRQDPGETRNWISDIGMSAVAIELEQRLDDERTVHEQLSITDRGENS